MIASIIVVIGMVVGTLTNNIPPSTDTYALIDLIKILNPTFNQYLLDGPADISHAPTTPTTNKKPSLAQMKYYNYYAASMYCQYQLSNLSCLHCKHFKKDINMHKVLMNNVTDNTALVTLSKSRKEIVVTFRGSQNVWNFVLDFTMFNVKYNDNRDNIKIHLGFYIATMSLYEAVVTSVAYLRRLYPDYKIVIVGHSLGGSMARLTSFFLLYLNQFPGATYEVYTYGEPRTGNKAYVDYLNRQNITSVRITSRADIAPHLMPTSILNTTILGDYFLHVQTEYWINGENGQKFCNQSVYEDPRCNDSMGPAYSLLDHFQYFDVNYLVCWLGQPGVLLAIPHKILQPIGTIPPLPQPINALLSDSLDFVMNVGVPLLGR